MSGWIKVEKELLTSFRFRRMVKAYRHLQVTDVTRELTRDVYADETILIGALVLLWMYADSHIGDDNILAITTEEIDELVGVAGFSQICPSDWLTILDANHVQLPEFLEHNGTSAKTRKQAAIRQATYRHKHQKATTLSDNTTTTVTQSNASNDARPDQTRPEETIPEKSKSREARAVRLPDEFILTAERRAVAEAENIDPDRTFARFRDYWSAISGAKARKLDWDATWRNWCRTESDRSGSGGRGAPTPSPKRFETAVDRLQRLNGSKLEDRDGDSTDSEGKARLAALSGPVRS